jgi:hypothetical protein
LETLRGSFEEKTREFEEFQERNFCRVFHMKHAELYILEHLKGFMLLCQRYISLVAEFQGAIHWNLIKIP